VIECAVVRWRSIVGFVSDFAIDAEFKNVMGY